MENKEILRKPKSHLYYKWIWNEKYGWWNLLKIKNKNDVIIETIHIIKKDREVWDGVLNNKGFIYEI